MKRAWIVAGLICVFYCFRCEGAETVETFGKFGEVTVYDESPIPSHVVLLVSGDGGWNRAVVTMAKTLATHDTLVVGINIVTYLKKLAASPEECSYPAADFEALSKFIQKKRNYPEYVTPLLVGHSSGATLVYATLVQAPPGTFLGGFGLGFCPDLHLKKPFCRGYGLEWTYQPKTGTYVFSPSTILKSKFIALQGVTDVVCDPDKTEEYIEQVAGAELILLPKVGHGYAVERNWFPQFMDAYSKFFESHSDKHNAEKSPVAELKDLPVVEVRAKDQSNPILAVILSGDGGWANIDRQLGEHLAANGMDVVGLNSLQYFWKKRTPEGTAKDLERIITHYLSVWNKKEVILVGYSLGADVLPFLVNRLPAQMQTKLKLIVLLGPSSSVDFEFHLSDWLGGFSDSTSLPVLPEVEKLKGKKIMCVYGGEEKNSLCTKLAKGFSESVQLEGGHHFDGNYKVIADSIMNSIQ